MDFFVNHSGFFLGVGIIMLLALIGYYADKKDSDKGKNDIKPVDKDQVSNKVDNNVSEENNKFINNFNYNSVDEKVNSIDGFSESSIPENKDLLTFSDNVNEDNISENISEISNDNISEINNTDSYIDNGLTSDVMNNSQDSSNQNNFSSSDFEDVSMSLDDLEKKNFDNIANNSNAFDDSENYYYSNLENSESIDSSELSDINSLDVPSSSDSVDMTESVDLDISPVESIDSPNIDIVQEPVVEQTDSFETIGTDNTALDNMNSLESSDLSTSESYDQHSHAFDNEISSDDKLNSFDNGGIPELFGDNSSELPSNEEVSSSSDVVTDSTIVDPLSNSSEDIWKF